MKRKPTKLINFKFPAEDFAELERIALLDERDKSKFIRQAIYDRMGRVISEKKLSVKLQALAN